MTDTAEPGLIDRTLRSLRQAWREIAGSPGDYAADLPDADLWRAEEQMQACIAARGGEVAARALAARIGQGYLNLSREGRRRFLTLLATRFGVDHQAVRDAAGAVVAADDLAADDNRLASLRAALDPPRVRLLTRFNGLPAGLKFLVDLRADLLPLSRDDPALAGLETDLRRLLTAWFDVGFLRLSQITWDSPAALLEKLIAYEAVHAINDWGDMKDRLDIDRRCFAFFHPRMPDEPLIFVEVALVGRMADTIQGLLDRAAPPADPSAAGAAMFFSISNTQPGLAGISLGDFLIKQVVDRLAAAFPGLHTFATLSPIPGFRTWLEQADDDNADDRRLTAAEARRLWHALAEHTLADHTTLADQTLGGPGAAKPETAVNDDRALLASVLDRPDWWRDAALAQAMQGPLTRLCARYLMRARRRSGHALNRVAHFHLSNGARIERLNWMGDISPNGLSQSAGLMINYLYKQDAIEENHHAYVTGGQIAASAAIRGLAKD